MPLPEYVAFSLSLRFPCNVISIITHYIHSLVMMCVCFLDKWLNEFIAANFQMEYFMRFMLMAIS